MGGQGHMSLLPVRASPRACYEFLAERAQGKGEFHASSIISSRCGTGMPDQLSVSFSSFQSHHREPCRTLGLPHSLPSEAADAATAGTQTVVGGEGAPVVDANVVGVASDAPDHVEAPIPGTKRLRKRVEPPSSKVSLHQTKVPGAGEARAGAAARSSGSGSTAAASGSGNTAAAATARFDCSTLPKWRNVANTAASSSASSSREPGACARPLNHRGDEPRELTKPTPRATATTVAPERTRVWWRSAQRQSPRRARKRALPAWRTRRPNTADAPRPIRTPWYWL